MSEISREDALAHFGVKGMRWGVRKSPSMSKVEDTRGNKLTKDDAKWAKKTANVRKGISAYNKAADTMNKTHIPRINNKPEYKTADFTKDSPLRRKYYKEYQTTFEKEFNKSLKETFGDSPSGLYRVKNAMGPDGLPSWSIDYTDVKHSDDSISIDIKFDAGKIVEFFIGDVSHAAEELIDNFLAHYGVRGMKWGVRKNAIPGVSARTNREAKKDANEYTKAKMFYGEGAGNRRKLIKATVEAKSKRDPSYKKAFDHHVNKTDMSKRASQARGERKRKDVKKSVGRTSRGIKNLALGTGAPVAASAAVLYYGYQNPAVRSFVNNVGKSAYSTVKSGQQVRMAKNLLRNSGFKL